MSTAKRKPEAPAIVVAYKGALTHQRLLERLSYCEESGEFRWLSGPRTGLLAASRHNKGYLAVRIDGVAYLLHRLAWLYVHGTWPSQQIDHINGDRSDNRLVNLRECTNAQNSQNVRAHRDGSGFLGASFDKRRGRWQAGIGVDGKRRSLGYFNTPEDAHSAYLKAKQNVHAFGGGHA